MSGDRECLIDHHQTQPEVAEDRLSLSLRPILVYSVTFLFIYLPITTSGGVQEIVSDSVNREFKSQWNGFEWSGYVSLGILNWASCISSWFMPPLISTLNPKRSLALGALGFNLSLATFLYPLKYGLYAATLLSGVSCAITWNAQGSYLAFISNEKDTTRNTGILWIIFQMAPILGNIVVTTLFRGQEYISSGTRVALYSGIIGFGLIGLTMTSLLKSPKGQEETRGPSPLKILGQALKLLTTLKAALLAIGCFHTGLVTTFITTFYTTAIGFTKAFGLNRKQYAGEIGMFIGAGQVAAGILLILTRRAKNLDFVLIFSCILSVGTFVSIYLNIPDEASSSETDEPAIIESSLELALAGAFLLGLTDGCFKTSMFRFIINHWPENNTPPFAIANGIQGLALGILYFTSHLFGMHVICIILSVTCTIGTACYIYGYRLKLST